MLRSVKRPSIVYDLVALAVDGEVSVGRESESMIRLDSPDVPFLLSRKHARVVRQPDGSLHLQDLGSTNGTYVARRGERVAKMSPDQTWELQSGDVIGFGGPDTILARRTHVSNPFIFKYYALELDEDEMDVGEAEVSMATQGNHSVMAGPRPASAPDLSEIQSACAKPEEMSAAAIVTARHGSLEHDSAQLQAHGSDQHQPAAQNQLRTPLGNAAGRENQGPPVATSTPKSTKMKEILSNHLTCPICCEWLLACHTLSCGHMFCGLCLATWLSQSSSCPSCRKPVAGMPVRCFQVDNTINDLLRVNLMSPAAKNERKRKQVQWEDIQPMVVQEWGAALQRRREQALEAAARHNRQLAGSDAPAGNENALQQRPVQGAQV